MSHPVIRVVGLTKVYQAGDVRVQALRGVDLDIHEGEFVALMGPSGSGKSTLMNLLGCLDRPTGGKYYFCGQDVGNLSRDDLARIRNERIGFVFQGFNLVPRTSAIDNVELPLLYSPRIKAKERRQRARALLERVGLAERMHHLPSQLSGGQQQRVAIARSMVNWPAIILADEPTGNLDSRTGLEILAEFQRLNAEEGQTLIMVTHDQGIANCCLRQIVMRDGRVESDVENPAPRNAAAELAAFDQSRELTLEMAS